MSYHHNKKKKTFKPLILYDSTRSSGTASADSNNTPVPPNEELLLIEEHRVKTKSMLEYNAQMWENEGRTRIALSDQPPSPQLKRSSAHYSDLQPNQSNKSSHSNRSSMSLADSISNTDDLNRTLGNVQQNRYSSQPYAASTANVLEPQTQNTTPLPLYSHELLVRTPPSEIPAMYNPNSPTYNHELLYTSARSEEEYEEEYDEEPFVQTTTFITEPQFHHVYKPQIDRKRRRGNLPKEVTEFLKRWLILHKKHPYPTEREKQALAVETGLMVNQISNWFINARRRILQPLLESESRQLQQEQRSASTSTSVGVNVVGGSSNTASNSNHKSFDKDNTMETTDITSGNYYPHQHHNYTSNSATNTSSLLLQLPTTEGEQNTELQRVEQRNTVPPPWVLLPTKLPSMNILEKDLEAFEPKD